MAKSETLKKIAAIIHSTLGLDFPGNRLHDLEKGMLASAKDLGISADVESVYNWISTSNLTTKELRIISSHITVGETYFFREQNSLKLFVRIILPELISKRKENSRQIKIWCAGCSSGEEPYTLAILIKENFPELGQWNTQILATDINPKAIQKAISGEYSEWSFRDTDPKIRQKYFSKKGNHWVVSNEIKEMVKFSFLNLSDKSYPSFSTGTENIDIIFCRNVFIYLSHEVIPEVAGKIYKSLADGGWLITSQVELNDIYFSMFGKYVYENNFFYRKAPVNYPSLRKPPVRAIVKSNRDLHTNFNPQPQSEKNFTLILNAKVYADRGDYDKAIEFIQKIIASGKADADIYYLYGTILTEQNKNEEAVEVLRKVLYLNPNHLLCHLMLGNFLSQNGKREQARKHYINALESIDDMKEDEIVPDSGGMTKGRIREMIENLILGQNNEK